MPDKSTLQERIREEVVSHTIWHFTGDKLLEFIVARWREAVGAFAMAALATIWGYLKGLSRLHIAMLGIAIFVVVLFVWDVIVARQRGRLKATALPSAGFPEKLGEIRFDYPGSPLDRWEFRSDNPQSTAVPTFSAPVDRAGGLTMTAPGSHHIDLKLEPHHKVCNRLKFEMKPTHDPQASCVYAKVRVTSKDGKTVSKTGWIACDVGNKPPDKHGPDEWIIYRKPLADGWTPFDLFLPEEIRKSRFCQEEGLEFSELLSIRLRGPVSVSPIGLYMEGVS